MAPYDIPLKGRTHLRPWPALSDANPGWKLREGCFPDAEHQCIISHYTHLFYPDFQVWRAVGWSFVKTISLVQLSSTHDWNCTAIHRPRKATTAMGLISLRCKHYRSGWLITATTAQLLPHIKPATEKEEESYCFKTQVIIEIPEPPHGS